ASSDTLTLDGQAGTDTYVTNTTGTHGDKRNYVVNVLDTGNADDGVDNLSVYGRDDTAAVDPTSQYLGPNGAFDDIFLLRRLTSTAGEPANRPALYANSPAFVAVLHGTAGQPVYPSLTDQDFDITVFGSVITRLDVGGSFVADGFKAGQRIRV